MKENNAQIIKFKGKLFSLFVKRILLKQQPNFLLSGHSSIVYNNKMFVTMIDNIIALDLATMNLNKIYLYGDKLNASYGSTITLVEN